MRRTSIKNLMKDELHMRGAVFALLDKDGNVDVNHFDARLAIFNDAWLKRESSGLLRPNLDSRGPEAVRALQAEFVRTARVKVSNAAREEVKAFYAANPDKIPAALRADRRESDVYVQLVQKCVTSKGADEIGARLAAGDANAKIDVAAKLRSGAPLTAQDILDCYKAFAKTAVEWMIEDAKAQGLEDFGPDDRQSFFGRITSVALSRLAARVGEQALARIAAALDTPDGRWLHHAMLAVPEADPGDLRDAAAYGSAETAAAFLEILVRRIPNKFGFQTRSGDLDVTVNYSAVPPFARAFVAQINPKVAAYMERTEPYDPSKAGPRLLTGVPAPVNARALPQNNAQRKQFLLGMLPIYHAHERTFDKGVNHHGRTHATRSFVLSIAMGNILREKGVGVDLNAVALGTAGHDTGRTKNSRDTAASEARSADLVNATVENLYPGAAGTLWKDQVKANLTANAAGQTTVEGYLFKSADSLDYWRVDELDEKKFPFLQTPILTADGIAVAKDPATRRQLMKEAKLLTELTSPRVPLEAEHKQLTVELLNLPDGPEFNAKNARKEELPTLRCA